MSEELRLINNDDIDFLRNLGAEMNTQEHDSQADPRFWVIREYREDAVWEEQASEYAVTHDGESVDLAEAIKEQYEETALSNYRYNDFSAFMPQRFGFYAYVRDEDGKLDVRIEVNDSSAAAEWLCSEDESYDLVPIDKVAHIVHNTFFITKAEAKRYIEHQRHNLAIKPHTYGMTALRSREVSRLWEILQNVDWERVKRAES